MEDFLSDRVTMNDGRLKRSCCSFPSPARFAAVPNAALDSFPFGVLPWLASVFFEDGISETIIIVKGDIWLR